MGITLASGSTFTTTGNAWTAGNFVAATGQSNGAAVLNQYINLTNVQLEVGSTATSFDYRPYGTELQLCQRYYNGISMLMAGYTQATVSNYYYIYLTVNMRTTPTYTPLGSTNTNCTGSTITPQGNGVASFSCIGAATGGFVGAANGSLSAEL